MADTLSATTPEHPKRDSRASCFLGCGERTEDPPPYAAVTRQMTLPTSSAISSELSGPSVTPTGRP